MKLYGLPFSPYTQRVLIAARLKGHELEVAPPRGGTIQSDEFAVIAAMRRIPVLEDGEDWHLCESAAIVEYLEEVLDGPSLLPDTPKGRARSRQVTAIADIEIGSGLRHFALQKMFTVYESPAQLDYGRKQVAQGFAALEHIGIGRDGFAVGPTPGATDAVLVPVLNFAEMVTEHFDGGPLIAGNPQVEAYWSRIKSEPVMARSIAAMAGIVPVMMGRRAAARA